MAAYPYPSYGGWQSPQSAMMPQMPNYPAQPQTVSTAQPATQQGQGFTIRPVASREEAVAVQTDFFSLGIIMPDLSHGMIYLKRFNQNTGSSDLLEFAYMPPQQPKQEQFATVDMFQQLFQRVEALEKKGVTVNGSDE